MMTNRRTCRKLDTDIHDIGHIYVLELKIGQNKYIKVGKTIDLDSRLKSYNGQLPYDMYSYHYTSEKMYNLSIVEHNILVDLNDLKSICPLEGRLEWYRRTRSGINRGAVPVLEMIVRIIQRYEDVFYEI